MSAARERGEILIDLGRGQEALEHLRNALAEDPGDGRAHCLVAVAYFQLGDAQAALTAADAGCAADPEAEWPHRLRSIALRALGRDPLPDALEAVRLEPEEPRTYVVLADALQDAYDDAGAEAAARHAIALDPALPEAHTALGDVLLAQSRPREAIAPYEAALALNPTNATVLNDLAVARLRARDGAGVEQQFESALRLDPNARAARRNLLETGAAGRTRVYRRFAVGLAIAAVITALDGTYFRTLLLLVWAALMEGVRAGELRRLSPATRTLLRDDNRARRFHPLRWNWRWPVRGWWTALMWFPPWATWWMNFCAFMACLTGGIVIGAVCFALLLPFSGWRWLRVWSRRHPGPDSWRPPGSRPSD